MDHLQPFAILVFIFIGFGIMFQVVRPKVVWFFVLFLLFLPFLPSALRGAGEGLVSARVPWQVKLVVLLVILFGLRFFIDNNFRKK